MILISGNDGSGKSTIINVILSEKKDYSYRWSRRPYYLSRVVSGYLRSFSKVISFSVGGTHISYYHLSKIERKILLVARVADYYILVLRMYLCWRVGKKIIWDRSVIDFIVDASCNISNMAEKYMYIPSFLRNTPGYLIVVGPSLARQRRPELIFDLDLEKRQKLFLRIGEANEFVICDNSIEGKAFLCAKKIMQSLP